MNEVTLKGILKNVEYSHTIDGVDFSKGILICTREDGREDNINIRFKSFSNIYKPDTEIAVTGNLRSYSYVGEDNNNKVLIYVFTYFNHPEGEREIINRVEIDGRICKMNPLRKTRSGKHNLHFIIANNLITGDNKRLNSYIPCISWGKLAKELSVLPVNTKLKLIGQLHSREHVKSYEDGTQEIRVAHELSIDSYEVIE